MAAQSQNSFNIPSKIGITHINNVQLKIISKSDYKSDVYLCQVTEQHDIDRLEQACIQHSVDILSRNPIMLYKDLKNNKNHRSINVRLDPAKFPDKINIYDVLKCSKLLVRPWTYKGSNGVHFIVLPKFTEILDHEKRFADEIEKYCAKLADE